MSCIKNISDDGYTLTLKCVNCHKEFHVKSIATGGWANELGSRRFTCVECRKEFYMYSDEIKEWYADPTNQPAKSFGGLFGGLFGPTTRQTQPVPDKEGGNYIAFLTDLHSYILDRLKKTGHVFENDLDPRKQEDYRLLSRLQALRYDFPNYEFVIKQKNQP